MERKAIGRSFIFSLLVVYLFCWHWCHQQKDAVDGMKQIAGWIWEDGRSGEGQESRRAGLVATGLNFV